MTKSNSLHAEASLHRKLVLFAVQLEGYLAHFPNCHKYTLTQALRQAFIDVYNLTTEAQMSFMEEKHNEMYRQLPAAFTAAHRG